MGIKTLCNKFKRYYIVLPIIAVVFLLLVLASPSIYAYTNVMYEHQDTGVFDATIFGTTWVAQSFMPTETFTITSVQLRLYRDGSPGIINVSIREANSNNRPTGGDYCSSSYNGNSVGLVPEWVEFNFGDGVVLNANNRYAIVLSVPFGGAGDDINWKYVGGNLYTRGISCLSLDSGVTWAALMANADFAFKTYGHPHSETNTAVQIILPIVGVIVAFLFAAKGVLNSTNAKDVVATFLILVLGAVFISILVVILRQLN